ncbi:MAG: sigma-70 family RNA polymerase sigma factor [Bacteroidales bacterium]
MLTIGAKHPDKTDEDLLGRYQDSGNLDLLGELYARHMHLVYGVSLKYLGDPEEAKDATMQIFEKLISELSGQEIRHFKSWLYVLTRNHCLMKLRSKKSGEKRLEGLKTEVEFMESGDDLHPMDRSDPSIEQALRECLDKLKAQQKECIELFYYKKMCYREISDSLGMAEKKVKSFLQNGKRNLKICLESKNVR